PRVDDRHFDLNSVGDAHTLIESRQARGKVVIDVAG
ncbi:MAG: quinone oxidoreductase, partial [Burkholderiaceae bacterium]